MKKQIEKLLLAALTVFAMGAAISSCNDYVADVNAALKGEIADLNIDLNADLSDLQTKLNLAIQNGDDNEARIQLLETAKTDIETALSNANTSIADLYTKYNALTSAVAAIGKDSIDALRTEINTKFAEALDSAAVAKTLAYRNQETLEALSLQTANIQNSVTDALAKLAAQESKITDTNARIDSVAGKLSEAETKITSLEDADKLLKAEIDTLKANVDSLKTALAELEERVTKIENQLSTRISSVVINGARTPMFGYFNLPVGIRSNMLAAYYGTAGVEGSPKPINFPSTSSYNTIVGEPFSTLPSGVTVKTWESGDVIVGEDGNAGQLYVTLNPADVYTDNVLVSLKNSIGEDAKISLSALEPSTDKLTFGYLRSAENGFYKMQATLDAADVEQAKIRVELQDFKDIINEVRNLGNGSISLSNIISSTYNILTDIADAYAVEAIYFDDQEDGHDAADGHRVYSDYTLAAFAVKPLSYNWINKDLGVTSMPGIARVSSLVNQLCNKIVSVNIPDFNLSGLKTTLAGLSFAGSIPDSIKFKVSAKVNVDINVNVPISLDVPIPSGTSTTKVQKTVNTTITIPAIYAQDGVTKLADAQDIDVNIPIDLDVEIDPQKVIGNTIHVEKTVTVTVPVEVPIDMPISIASSDVLGGLGTTLDNMDTLMGQINAMIDDVSSTISNLETQKNNIASNLETKLNSYLDKINNKFCSLVNSLPGKLQPIMTVCTDNGFQLLSSIKTAPTTVKGTDITLFPTSLTAEFLAPAALKYVVVTDAYNTTTGAALASEAERVNGANEALNTVFDGAPHTAEGEANTVAINGLQSGNTYEITYSAMDFFGYVVNTKYYISVID